MITLVGKTSRVNSTPAGNISIDVVVEFDARACFCESEASNGVHFEVDTMIIRERHRMIDTGKLCAEKRIVVNFDMLAGTIRVCVNKYEWQSVEIAFDCFRDFCIKQFLMSPAEIDAIMCSSFMECHGKYFAENNRMSVDAGCVCSPYSTAIVERNTTEGFDSFQTLLDEYLRCSLFGYCDA